MPNLGPFFFIVLPILTVLAAALAGRTRRIGFWPTLILSILLTPIGGILVAFISGPKHRKPKARHKSASPKP